MVIDVLLLYGCEFMSGSSCVFYVVIDVLLLVGVFCWGVELGEVLWICGCDVCFRFRICGGFKFEVVMSSFEIFYKFFYG